MSADAAFRNLAGNYLFFATAVLNFSDLVLHTFGGEDASSKADPKVGFGMGTHGPGKLPELGKFPRVVRRACNRFFGSSEQKPFALV